MNRIAILLAVAACGDNTTGTTFVMRVGDEAPAYGDAPFPTDALKQGDTMGVSGLLCRGGEHVGLTRKDLPTWPLTPSPPSPTT